MAGDLLHVADVFDRLFDQRDVGRAGVLDDVVDHEHLRVRQRGQHPPDVFARGGDELHVEPGQRADFVDQEQVRRLADGQDQRAADHEQRQHQVLLDELAGQHVDDFGIVQPSFQAGVGHAVLRRQAFDDVFFGAIARLDQDFSQQLILPARLPFLLCQRGLQVGCGNVLPLDEQIAQPRRAVFWKFPPSIRYTNLPGGNLGEAV